MKTRVNYTGLPRHNIMRIMFQLLAQLSKEDQDFVLGAIRRVFEFADEEQHE